jgi:ABC-type tungstate transport system permease subunit
MYTYQEYQEILNNPNKLRGLDIHLVKVFIEYGINLEKEKIIAELAKKVEIHEAMWKELFENSEQNKDMLLVKSGVIDGFMMAIELIKCTEGKK